MGSIKNYIQIKKKLNLFTSEDEYSHIYRRKSLWEMMRLSFAIMGIEFTYAALTAFVSPVLLELGVNYQQMTMVWAISPIIGFFLSPIMGSLSDRCRLKFGRRRPFMIAFAIINVMGLLLIPYGESFAEVVKHIMPATNSSTPAEIERIDRLEAWQITQRHIAIVITVIGVVIADYTSDALQNPSRAYLLDVCRADDHARGLTTFTVLAGLGGFVGYLMGAIDWTKINIFDFFQGSLFNGHIQAFYTMTAVLFTICILITITTFREVPLPVVELIDMCPDVMENGRDIIQKELKEITPIIQKPQSYGVNEEIVNHDQKSVPTLKDYVKSIFCIPYSLRILCITNLFCWMAQCSYSLYFTDFVGEAVYGGDPSAPVGSEERTLYEDGVRVACLGMAIYSLSCMFYSFGIESLVKRFGLKKVYVGSILVDAVALLLMAAFRNKIAVIILSALCGVLYATLFTVPYILIAHYHSTDVFEIDSCGDPIPQKQIRGLGTDVSVIGSCIFVAQFLLSICMGGIVAYAQTTTAVVITGAVLAICAAFAASKVMYLDL